MRNSRQQFYLRHLLNLDVRQIPLGPDRLSSKGESHCEEYIFKYPYVPLSVLPNRDCGIGGGAIPWRSAAPQQKDTRTLSNVTLISSKINETEVITQVIIQRDSPRVLPCS